MILEYAKPMTTREVNAFFKSLEDDRQKNYRKSLDLLTRYKDILLEEHRTYDAYFAEECEKVRILREEAQKVKDAKVCVCGAKIRYVSGSYNFWGCSSYHNREVEHRNYEDRSIEHAFPWPVPNHWISDIRNKLNLPKSLRTGHIYHFYLDNGYADLLLKYTGVSSEKVVYKLCDTRDKAKSFEKEQFEIICSMLNKCAFQFAIRYKYQGSKEKISFLDILGSDDKTVYIYECKTTKRDIDIFQRDTYIELVQRILDDLAIRKDIKFVYLIEREDNL